MEKISLLLRAGIVIFFLQGCGSEADEEGNAYPSDKQVVAELTPKNDKGFIAVEVTKSGKGEAYQKNLQWYYDRGAVVKRKADIAGAEDAVLLVGGLARYQLMGDTYKFAKFITTYNEYEGIPAPNKKELVKFVHANLKKVFESRDHNIFAINKLEMEEGPWTWHNANSFTVPFALQYEERINNTTIDARQSTFDIRFYRNDIKAPMNALMATEGDRQSLGQTQYRMDVINQMPSIRTGLAGE